MLVVYNGGTHVRVGRVACVLYIFKYVVHDHQKAQSLFWKNTAYFIRRLWNKKYNNFG